MRAGVQGVGRRAVDGVARLVFVGDRGGRTGHQGSVGRAGDAAPLARQDGCHGRGGDQAVGRGRDGGVEGFAGRGRAIGARERDIDGGVGFFSRPGSARHGVGGRLRRRVQGPFQGRAGLRGAGPWRPRGPCRFLHGRVRVPQDARPVVGAGPGPGRDRPRPGDGRRAGTGSRRRAPRWDARHHQTGEGRGRRARPRRSGGSRRGARTGRTWPASPACAWPTDASAARRARRRARPRARRPVVRHRHGHRGAPRAPEQAVSWGRLAWRRGRSRAPFRPWRAVHRPRVRHRGRGIRHASPPAGTAGDPYRHGRERRRRVQDPRLAARALPGSEGPGIGDVPVGLVAGTRSVRTGPRTAGHRNGPKPGIARTKRCKPPHYKSGTKIRPYHYD